MELTISIIGAVVAIIVSVVGAYLANRNSIILQTRKLKESHYINYVSSLHNLCAYNDNKEVVAEYVKARDVLFTVATTEVISRIIEFEHYVDGCKTNDNHDKHLTLVIEAIRKDLKLSNKNLPLLYFKHA